MSATRGVQQHELGPSSGGGSARGLARRQIGTTPIRVSELGFGGADLARLTGREAAKIAAEAVDAAWSAGIRYFDTAPYYGLGLSERRLGDGLRVHPRESWVLSTKVGRQLIADDGPPSLSTSSEPLPFRTSFRYDHSGIMRSFEDSLQRLGLNRVDILLIHDLTSRHHPDAQVLERHFEDLFTHGGYRALVELRDQKVISAIGAGVNSWRICERLAHLGDFDLFLLAGHYTLLDQDALTSFLPLCQQRNISVVLGGVYNTGVLVTGPVEGAQYDYRPASEAIKQRVVQIQEVCAGFGVPLAAAALQFPLRHPTVSSVIPGMRSADHVSSNVALFEIDVPMELYLELQRQGLLTEAAPIGQ